jgi:phosphoribosylglycinamide formyltransferase 1
MKKLKPRLKLGVFISGHGTNLQALIDNCENGSCNAEILFVISNKETAFGLTRARNHNIPSHVLKHTDYSSREEFDLALLDIAKLYNPDLICLAGFMRILTPVFLDRFKNRVLNIHPSLLPNHKGLHTHKRVLESGDKIHGCTVHIVTPELDDGEIITQRSIPVFSNDTEDSLNDRVLAEEIIAYTEAVNIMAKKLS